MSGSEVFLVLALDALAVAAVGGAWFVFGDRLARRYRRDWTRALPSDEILLRGLVLLGIAVAAVAIVVLT